MISDKYIVFIIELSIQWGFECQYVWSISGTTISRGCYFIFDSMERRIPISLE